MLVLVSVPEPSADRAVSGDILVSLDGANWSTTLPLGLFSNAGIVAPGDSLSRTLWIENTSSSPAVLRLSRIETTGTSSVFSHAISLSATARGANGSPPLAADGSCTQLVPLEIADRWAGQAQGQSATISLLASMRSLGTTASPCPGRGPDIRIVGAAETVVTSRGSHDFSGAGLACPAITMASASTGVALFAHLATRRRRDAL